VDTDTSILRGVAAVVTGGTKGVGRGVAAGLARRGATVFATGRSIASAEQRTGAITRLRCDHTDDAAVDTAFARIAAAAGPIDILAMFAAGVRAHYRASQLAARSMVERRRGLIVNISHWAARKRIGNVAYGVSKASTDKMTADMGEELKPHGVAVVSLYAAASAHHRGRVSLTGARRRARAPPVSFAGSCPTATWGRRR
jgi:NAD(P)-dependent dehydrogenase (short-subunit alcohol dehydrogenase family)